VPGNIVILDNRRAHNGAGIRERMGACGAQLIYWPPYSPDLSPMEPCWSKLTTLWRTAQARTQHAIDAAIEHVWAAVTRSDARGWFRHCGDALRELENRSSLFFIMCMSSMPASVRWAASNDL
jgi:transposase